MVWGLRTGLDRLRDQAKLALRASPVCEIGWQPSPYSPVFYGYRDVVVDLSLSPLRDPDKVVAVDPDHLLTTSGLTETHARIFYPSVDGSPPNAPILTGCGRYPLVLFAHGHCGQPGGWMPDHHAWIELCATLARSGYIVVAPLLAHGDSPPENVLDRARVVRMLQWMRARWEHRDALLPASATGLAGHSWGAGVCAEVIGQGLHEAAAFASLSGKSIRPARSRAGLPKLCTYGGDNDEVLMVALDDYQTSVAAPAHVVRFGGANHYEYIPHPMTPPAGQPQAQPRIGCTQEPAGCRYVPYLAADLVTLFFARNLHGENWDTSPAWWPPFLPWPHQVGVALRPPWMLLTTAQKFFAGGQWAVWPTVAAQGDCDTDIRWTDQGSWHERSV